MADETTPAPEGAPVAEESAAVTPAETSADTTSESPAEVVAEVAPPPAPTLDEVDESRPNRRKVREGIVVSDRMDATLVVAVVDQVRHPRYGKTMQRTKRLYVHDAENAAKVGDRVRVVETRPLSKLKRWRLAEVTERAR